MKKRGFIRSKAIFMSYLIILLTVYTSIVLAEGPEIKDPNLVKEYNRLPTDIQAKVSQDYFDSYNTQTKELTIKVKDQTYTIQGDYDVKNTQYEITLSFKDKVTIKSPTGSLDISNGNGFIEINDKSGKIERYLANLNGGGSITTNGKKNILALGKGGKVEKTDSKVANTGPIRYNLYGELRDDNVGEIFGTSTITLDPNQNLIGFTLSQNSFYTRQLGTDPKGGVVLARFLADRGSLTYAIDPTRKTTSNNMIKEQSGNLLAQGTFTMDVYKPGTQEAVRFAGEGGTLSVNKDGINTAGSKGKYGFIGNLEVIRGAGKDAKGETILEFDENSIKYPYSLYGSQNFQTLTSFLNNAGIPFRIKTNDGSTVALTEESPKEGMHLRQIKGPIGPAGFRYRSESAPPTTEGGPTAAGSSGVAPAAPGLTKESEEAKHIAQLEESIAGLQGQLKKQQEEVEKARKQGTEEAEAQAKKREEQLAARLKQLEDAKKALEDASVAAKEKPSEALEGGVRVAAPPPQGEKPPVALAGLGGTPSPGADPSGAAEELREKTKECEHETTPEGKAKCAKAIKGFLDKIKADPAHHIIFGALIIFATILLYKLLKSSSYEAQYPFKSPIRKK